ncbi:hypothetical protein HHI36_010980 [Cryptolaemus montrouzieri]|uniref:MD-2-related lipid-recognition domain-containing protein n=1 Tax=Cryptolaemus montrouzieri TaxID=559131 RepID=A0ABD2MKD1_9CUCU
MIPIKKLVVPVLVFYFFVDVQGTFYYDCEDVTTLGKVQSLAVINCTSEEPTSKCRLRRGANTTIDLTFKSDVDLDAIKVVVHGIIAGESKSFALPNSNGCNDSGLTCPVTKDSVVTYTTSLPVKKFYPKISVDVKWELRSKDDKDIVCIIIPSHLN